VTGGTAVIVPRFSASRFFQQAQRYNATMVPLFAAPLRMLLNQPHSTADARHRLRNVTFAQNLTQRQYADWHERFKAPLQQLWGMTETVSVPIVSPLAGERNLTAMGRPIPGYEVRIVDEENNDVPVGQVGQLIVRGTTGRSIMVGYYKDREATARALRTRWDGTWLYTGDMVYTDENSFIYFVDLDKDLIKRAGERISSVEIESVIQRCDGVRDASIVTIPDPVRDEFIVAVVVADDPALTDDVVKSFCRAHLSPFKVPERVLFLNELPRTSVGKIQKHLIRQQLIDKGLDAWATTADMVRPATMRSETIDRD
jgi:crotonobetaine/carnitine-CoA ligase